MKLFKLSSLYIFLYLAVILLLLFKTFSQEEIVRYNIEGLEVSETLFKQTPIIPKKIKSMLIRHRGVVFNISYTNPVSITSDDGLKRNSHIIDTEIVDGSLKINLKNGVTLFFRVDNYGERLTVTSNIPKVFPTIRKLSIPLITDSSYDMERTDLSHRFFNDDDEFHLKLNDNYIIGENKNYIHLLAEGDKVSTLTFSPLDNKELPIAEQWYMKHRDINAEKIDLVKEEYLSKVKKRIQSIYNPMKYNAELKAWQNNPKKSLISENSTIIYLSEAIGKTGYKNKLERIKYLKKRYPREFGFNSAPFLGNLVSVGKTGMQEDQKEFNSIQALIRNSDSRILNRDIPSHFFDNALFYSSRLEKIINSTDKESLNLEQLKKALYNLVEILEAGTTNSESTNSIKEISNIIISKIKWDDTGLYLTENLEKSSQMLNLETGLLLIKASQHETSEYSKPIGEALITTFINNSNKSGQVPEYYDLENSRASTKQIAAEDIYLKLSDSPYIPHFITNKGIKVWTISDSVTIMKNSRETSITISYPVKNSSEKNSHHFIASGIKPYKQLYYRNQPWRADKNFEKWGVGYYYEQNTQLLYFMLSHNRSREKVVITYE